MVAPDGIVTPEAVVLEFETAGLASRLFSAAIDVVIQVVVLVVLLLAAAAIGQIGAVAGVASAFVYVALFLVVFGYPAAFETLLRGRTPGKAALGLRVVTVEGAPVRFRHAAIRAIVGVVDKVLMSGAIGMLAILATRRNQRLGDLVAGTIVLRERSGVRSLQSVAFAAPYGLEGYVESLDAAALGHADYATVRSFLLRAPALTGPARQTLASQIATPLLSRLRTVPPPGVAPEVFLVCVAAAYQRRSNARAREMPAPTFQSLWSAAALGLGAGPTAAPVGPPASDPSAGAATTPATTGDPAGDAFAAPS